MSFCIRRKRQRQRERLMGTKWIHLMLTVSIQFEKGCGALAFGSLLAQKFWRFHIVVLLLFTDLCEWQSCEIMAELVEGLRNILALGHPRNSAIPSFLTPTLRNIVISLSRLPLVNSYTRVPPLVSIWTNGYASICSKQQNGLYIHGFNCFLGLEVGLVPSARRRVWHNLA